jgi:hypothetical protein
MGGVTYLTELAKTLGAKNIFTSAKNTRYLEKLKSCDFKETDVGMTNLIRSL